MNKAIIVGRLGKDVELKTTQNGTSVATVSIATDDRVKRGDAWEKVTDWHSVVLWGKDAEFASKYFAKGDGICIEGKMKRRKYQTQDGSEREVFEVVADRVSFVPGAPQSREGRPASAPSPRAPYGPPAAAQGHRRPAPDEAPEFDDDIPF
jgi:single-strand DNA-binding protein